MGSLEGSAGIQDLASHVGHYSLALVASSQRCRPRPLLTRRNQSHPEPQKLTFPQ